MAYLIGEARTRLDAFKAVMVKHARLSEVDAALSLAIEEHADSTHVLVWYTPTALYIGVRAFETHGGGAAVHATLADRDKISADDNVQIVLGTFNDQRQAFVFGVNPLGVQMDGTIVETGQSLTGGWGGTSCEPCQQ